MIYMFLADGFEEIEAVTPLDILKRLGADIKTVGVGGSIIRGAHDIYIKADISLDSISDDFEMLILPGGIPGTENLRRTPQVIDALKKANEQGKFIAAICAAPMILGQMGMLEGKNATSFPDYQKYLTGANVCDKPVVVDKNIITAKGAGAASMFGFTLGGLLFGNAAAENLKGKMQYDG